MLKLLAVLFVLLLPLQSFADSAFVILGSHHTDNGNYCEFNPGLIYQSEQDWLGGFYRNSECDWVGVAGKNIYTSAKFKLLGRESYLALPVGLVVGYERYPVMPWALPTIAVSVSDHISMGLSVIPLKEPIFGFGMVVDF